MSEIGKSYEKWLGSLSQNYAWNCKGGFLRFLEFLGEQGLNINSDQLIERHRKNRKSPSPEKQFEIDDLIPQYQKWLMKKYKLSHNSALTKVNMVQSFFKYFREPLKLQRGTLQKQEVVEKFHVFKYDELVRMFQLANLEEKALLSLGLCVGLRVDDFIHLERSTILEAHERDKIFPIEFQLLTSKEKVIASCHVTEECFNILQDYWRTKSESKWVFPSNHEPISDDKAEDLLRRAFQRAYPNSKDRIRFHNLRKYLMNALANASINHWHILRIIGKKIPPSEATYLNDMDILSDYNKIIPLITLNKSNNNNNHERLDNLEQEVSELRILLGEYQAELARHISPESVEDQE